MAVNFLRRRRGRMMGENILRKIGGQYVAEALQTLPTAETSTENLQETVFELPVRAGAVYVRAHDGKARKEPIPVLDSDQGGQDRLRRINSRLRKARRSPVE